MKYTHQDASRHRSASLCVCVIGPGDAKTPRAVRVRGLDDFLDDYNTTYAIAVTFGASVRVASRRSFSPTPPSPLLSFFVRFGTAR